MTIVALFQQRPAEYSDDEDMPVFPGMTLVHHVVARGALVGTFFGSAGSLMRILYKVHVAKESGVSKKAILLRGTQVGLLAGASLGAVMVFSSAAFKPLDLDGVADRGYRLANNKVQRAVDSTTTVAGTVGAIYGYMNPELGKPSSVRIIGCAGLGALGGMLGLFIFNKIIPLNPKN